MQTLETLTTSAIELKNPDLFRETCYIDGQWVEADPGQTILVDNPASGEIIGSAENGSGRN